MDPLTTTLLFTLLPLLILYLWQIAADVRHWTISPGAHLTALRAVLERLFDQAGRGLAYLSSYLTWLRFDILWNAAVHLLEPLVGVLLSWYAFFRGYVLAAASYTSSRYTIYLGTIIPTGVLVGLLYCYTPVFRWVFQGACGVSGRIDRERREVPIEVRDAIQQRAAARVPRVRGSGAIQHDAPLELLRLRDEYRYVPGRRRLRSGRS